MSLRLLLYHRTAIHVHLLRSRMDGASPCYGTLGEPRHSRHGLRTLARRRGGRLQGQGLSLRAYSRSGSRSPALRSIRTPHQSRRTLLLYHRTPRNSGQKTVAALCRTRLLRKCLGSTNILRSTTIGEHNNSWLLLTQIFLIPLWKTEQRTFWIEFICIINIILAYLI